MKEFWDTVKIILFDVSPGDGYFGGMEGFIRMIVFSAILVPCIAIYMLVF